MDQKIVEAYEYLVPADQTLIDALILAFATVHMEKDKLTKEFLRHLQMEKQK